MRKLYTAAAVLLLLSCFMGKAFGQQPLVSGDKKQKLADFTVRTNSLYLSGRAKALQLAKAHHWDTIRRTKNGGLVLLQGVNSLGFPVYLVTHNNTTAAATTGTNTVQPGGALGLNLSGASPFLNNKLAIWDGGAVYAAHQEFAGKTITIEDTSGVIDHATHVAGTMLAKGVYPPAKGMAFNAATLHSYYFANDVTKMGAAASQLLLSNHSYGDEAGWNFNDLANRWEWYGLPGDSVDYNFGFYGQRTQQWDEIAFDAPYYLIVESAGNAHAYPGPAIGTDYYGYASASNPILIDKGPRPAGISNNTGYDVISTTGNAKNILTIGAINPLPNGPSNSASISIASFSSWGPTDDGRVKPDIVADGVNVTSCGSSSPSDYITLSGTSMAAPNVTGSLYLLQEYYAEKNNGNFMKAATLKGLACHTAFDAGNPGPDYIYGWGLLDMKKAAQVITDNGTKSMLKENTLQQGQQQTYKVVASGNGPLMATISWTDPPGTPTADGVVNSRTPKLVNDLDIRVSDGTTTFMPWILDPANPSAPAKTGDNIVDNVEQAYIANAVPGRTYTITVSHKGTLQNGSQDYSIIATGIGGAAYCTSGPLSSADSKINNLKLSNINYTAAAGCTSYTDLTAMTVNLEQGKTYPLTITLGTCGANFDKAVKVFIDWNGDGIFEAGELAATSSIVNGTAVFNTNITVPTTVTPGNYSLMRVVLSETEDTSSIQACGTYAKGETQDYRVQFLPTTIDAGITAIVSPDAAGACPAATQVTVTVENFGAAPISNVPVTVTITNPDATITTINQTYVPVLQPLEQENFTLNGTFNAVAGSTYTITATTNLPGDVITSNNQASETVMVNPAPVVSGLSAYYCVNTKEYQLSGTGNDGELLWYQNPTDTIPFAWGQTVGTAQATTNNTWYAGLNDFNGTVGPVTKYTFSGGGYNQFTPYVNVSTKIPVIIQSARLYIGNSGQITFNVADSTGEVLSTTTINAVATSSNPQPGAQADDPNDQGVVYNLNLLLPSAGSYTITAVFDSTATIYRSNAGVTGYPFTIGGIFSITGNNASTAPDTSYKTFYYYFYDMKVKSAGCMSASRQAVTLTKPVITQNGSSLSSSFVSDNQWYLDGQPITPATTSQAIVAKVTGYYQVAVNLPTGCQLRSDSLLFVATNTSGDNSDIGLTVFPVPANNMLNIIFQAKTSGSLTTSLINAGGLTVYSNEQAVTTGNFSTTVDVSALPPGVYILRLALGDKLYKDKIIVAR